MRNPFLLLVVPAITIAAVVVACKSSESSSDEALDEDAGQTIPPADTTSNPTTTDAPTGPAGTGLPCDIQALLENRCQACHDGQMQPALMTYADLMAKSTKDPTKSRAVLSLELMKSKAMPPTPAVPPEDDEIAAFDEWVKAGTPKNPAYCNETDITDGGAPMPTDGGIKVDGGGDGGTCTSGKFWTQGDNGSQLMHPGAACNACHQQKGGPNLRFAGTVFPSLHEPNDCNGSAPPPALQVIVTDSRNKTVTMQVNAAGNFMSTTKGLRAPYKARVTDGTKTRAMNGSVTSGDCNSCHSQAGTKNAPGRILAP